MDLKISQQTGAAVARATLVSPVEQQSSRNGAALKKCGARLGRANEKRASRGTANDSMSYQ